MRDRTAYSPEGLNTILSEMLPRDQDMKLARVENDSFDIAGDGAAGRWDVVASGLLTHSYVCGLMNMGFVAC